MSPRDSKSAEDDDLVDDLETTFEDPDALSVAEAHAGGLEQELGPALEQDFEPEGEAEPEADAEAEPEDSPKSKKKAKAKAKKKPKGKAGLPPGVVLEKPRANIYTALLAVAFVAIIIGCACLYAELGRYGWTTKPM